MWRRHLPLVRWLLGLVAVVALIGVAKRAHRLADPPAASFDEMRSSLALVQALMQPPRSTDEALRALARPAEGPVFVSIYVPGAVGQGPFVGRWQPGGGAASLGQAIEAAGRQAVSALEQAQLPAEQRARARLKVDLAGPDRRLWTRAGFYLDGVVDPGNDGLVAERGGRQAWWLPSWAVERGTSAPQALRRLEEELGGKADRVARFHSRAFVDGAVRERGPLALVRGNVLRERVDPPLLRQSLLDAAEFLVRSVLPDGRYCYTYDAGQNACDRDYNLLRHAGTTYSLYQLYREFHQPSVLAAAERATGWLRQQVRPVQGDASRAFLLEGDRAKLGAVGLAMLALVERERAVGDGADRALLVQLADFVRSQQRDDGYFYSYFAWGPEAVVPPENSIYYPGEALLGLVRLYGIDPQERYLSSALRGAEFLVKRRWRWGGAELYVPPDAWLTQALAELDAVSPADWMQRYTYALVRTTELTMLRRDEGAPEDLAGGPGAGPLLPNVTPAGSRNEGLTSAYRMAMRHDDPARAAAIRALSLESARFQIGQQFRPANSYFLPDPGRALGGFREAPHKLGVRIDYVQHNVSGLLGLLSILREKRP